MFDFEVGAPRVPKYCRRSRPCSNVPRLLAAALLLASEVSIAGSDENLCPQNFRYLGTAMRGDFDSVLGKVTKYGTAEYYPGASFALILGVGRYLDPQNDIASSEQDADAMAAMAARQGYRDIYLLKSANVTNANIQQCIRHAKMLSNQPDPITHRASAKKISRFLLYFSGHGSPATTKASARLLLHSFDVNTASSQRGLARAYIEPVDLAGWTEELRSFHQTLFVVDACHAGSNWFQSTKSIRTINTATEWTLRSSLEERSALGLGSSLNAQTSKAGPEDGGLSYFTAALLDGLVGGDGDGDGLVSASELVRHATGIVAQRTNNNQIPVGPFILDNTEGSIVFVSESTDSSPVGTCPVCATPTIEDCASKYATTSSPPRWNGTGLPNEIVVTDFAIISGGILDGVSKADCDGKNRSSSQSTFARRESVEALAKCGRENFGVTVRSASLPVRWDAFAAEATFGLTIQAECPNTMRRLVPGFEVSWRVPFRLDLVRGMPWVDYQIDAAIDADAGFQPNCTLSIDAKSGSAPAKFSGRIGEGDHSMLIFCRNDKLPEVLCPKNQKQEFRIKLRVAPRFKKGNY